MWLILIIPICNSVRILHYLCCLTTIRFCSKGHPKFLFSYMLISFTMYNVSVRSIKIWFANINYNFTSRFIWRLLFSICLIRKNILKDTNIYLYPLHETVAFTLLIITTLFSDFFSYSAFWLRFQKKSRNPLLIAVFFLYFTLLFKVKNISRSMRYKSFIIDKTRQDEKDLCQKFPKEHLER